MLLKVWNFYSLDRKHSRQKKNRFSFSFNVFERLLTSGHQKFGLCGIALKQLQTCGKFEELAEKGGNDGYEDSLLPNRFQKSSVRAIKTWDFLFKGLNPLPDDKILDWSKFKQIADDILKCI